AMKGLFDDGTVQFTVKKAPDIAFARRIMFDDNYHADKAKIMNPIDDFINLLDLRTHRLVAQHSRSSNKLLGSIIGLIILISGISIISYFRTKNKIIKQLEELKLAKEKVEINEDKLKKQNELLDKLVDERTKELKESEIRFNEAQQIAHIGNWELDLIKNTLHWSNEIYRIFNLEPQEFGATYEAFLDNIHPDDREFVNTAYTESVKNKTPYNIVHRLLLKDGTPKFVNESCETFYDNAGKAVRSVGTVQDITKRRRAEEEREEALNEAQNANKVKSLFIANMSHEIRTPLNSILGFVDLIAEQTRDLLGKEWDKYFGIIDRNSKRLMRTVHDILDISLIESGTYDLRPEKFDLKEVIELIVQDKTKDAQSKKLELTFSATMTRATIKSDRHSIETALTNLVDNAIKYTDHGSVDLHLRKENKQYELTITDTGIGITNEYMDQMFESFSQESEGYTKKFQGLGLGLAITKNCLDMNNIKLDVKSKKGKGTTFTLTFKPSDQS
ncbi:MAG: PAS domain-containing sensor histidine kinase, partial [Candidatus Neomarinimicrobiota bacterium]